MPDCLSVQIFTKFKRKFRPLTFRGFLLIAKLSRLNKQILSHSIMKKTSLLLAKDIFFQVWFCIILLTIFSTSKSSAQIIKSGNLTSYIYSIINNLPGDGGNNYFNPSTSDYEQWKILINTLLSKNYASATLLANSLKYDLIEFTDGQIKYYILKRQDNASNYWGTYVFGPNGCRNLVIKSPHPKSDFNTGHQGIYVLKKTKARFFCLAGTHRCNHFSPSSCSGITTACNTTNQPFRIFDVAHNDSSIFQATTTTLRDFDSTLVFIQLHGFIKTTTGLEVNNMV